MEELAKRALSPLPGFLLRLRRSKRTVCLTCMPFEAELCDASEVFDSNQAFGAVCFFGLYVSPVSVRIRKNA